LWVNTYHHHHHHDHSLFGNANPLIGARIS
jgi:hypothetical protein